MQQQKTFLPGVGDSVHVEVLQAGERRPVVKIHRLQREKRILFGVFFFEMFSQVASGSQIRVLTKKAKNLL